VNQIVRALVDDVLEEEQARLLLHLLARVLYLWVRFISIFLFESDSITIEAQVLQGILLRQVVPEGGADYEPKM